ncbi:unnamed protein product, partial [Prorocentrum cordatum]
EQARGARPRELPEEDWQARLVRVEREQRSAALSLRLVASASEEAEKRQSRRLQALEEQLGLRGRAAKGDCARAALLAPDPPAPEPPEGAPPELPERAAPHAVEVRARALGDRLQGLWALLDGEAPARRGQRGAAEGRTATPRAASAEETAGARLGEVCAEVQAVRAEVASNHREVQSAQERLARELESRLDAAAALWGAPSARAEGAEALGRLESQVQLMLSQAEAHRKADVAVISELRERLAKCESSRADSDIGGLRQNVGKLTAEWDCYRDQMDAARRAHERVGKPSQEREAGRGDADVWAELKGVLEVQLATSDRRAREVDAALEQLRTRMDSLCVGVEERKADSEKVCRLCDRVNHLITSSEAQMAETKTVRDTVDRLTVCCDAREQDSQGALSCLRGRLDELAQLGEAHRASVTETIGKLGDKLDRLPTPDRVAEFDKLAEQIATSSRRAEEVDAALEQLRTRMDSLCVGVEERKADSEKVCRLCDRVNHLITSSEAQMAETKTVRDTVDRLTVCCDAREQDSQGALSCLRGRLDELAQLGEAHRASVTETIGKLGDKLDGLPAPDELANLRASVEEHAAAVAELGLSVRSVGTRSAEGLAELRLEVEAGQGPADDEWASGLGGGGAGAPGAIRPAPGEAVEERLSVAVWRIDRQLPEALERVEWLAGENAERHARLQEHDVRLGMALTRLAAHEQKVQAFSDRLELLPSLAQLRGMWQDELRRRLEEADVRGLGQTVASQAGAIEELTDAVQALCDRLALRGDLPPAAQQPL